MRPLDTIAVALTTGNPEDIFAAAFDKREEPYQAAGTHRNRQFSAANQDLRLLDTIAVALTTGNSGDIFAAAFDKRERIQLVLAKNGPPTPDDIAAAEELICLIGSPAVSNAMHLFPFLMRRCGANIDKRIRNLHESIRELYDDFTSALEEYELGADVMAEFPSAGLLLGEYGDVVPSFVSLWGYFIEEIIALTAQGLNAGDVYSSRKKYAQIFLLADALRFSRFLKTLVEDCNILNSYRTGRAKKLKRRLDKVCQYVTGIRHLIQKAKRLFPIPHRWVMDKFTGTGEGVIDLADNPYDAISCGLVCPSLSSKIGDELDNRFTSMLSNW